MKFLRRLRTAAAAVEADYRRFLKASNWTGKQPAKEGWRLIASERLKRKFYDTAYPSASLVSDVSKREKLFYWRKNILIFPLCANTATSQQPKSIIMMTIWWEKTLKILSSWFLLAKKNCTRHQFSTNETLFGKKCRTEWKEKEKERYFNTSGLKRAKM